MSKDWEVTVITDSGFFKKVRVDNCITRQDAEATALGMTGGKRVAMSNPKTYKDEPEFESDYSTSSSSGDAGGYLVIGILVLCYMFWKTILLVGCISLVVWLILKWAMSDSV